MAEPQHVRPSDVLPAIDRELKTTTDRRARSRSEISRLSQSVVNDTRRIDALLAERATAVGLNVVPDTIEGLDAPVDADPSTPTSA